VPIGKAVREYTNCISKSRMISYRVCFDMWGAFAGMGCGFVCSVPEVAEPGADGWDADGWDTGVTCCACAESKLTLRKETGKRRLQRRPIHHPNTGNNYSAVPRSAQNT
jgi:hypothetical protein